MKKALAILAATGMLTLAGAAGSASAATTTPSMATIQALVNRVDHAPNPKAAFNNLSSADKKLFREATTPYGAPKILGAKMPHSVMNPAYTGCWGHYDKVELQNVFGWRLATGNQETHICASNGSVTNVWVDSIDGSGAWAYSWEPSKTVQTTYNAGWEGRGAVHFAFNVTGTGDSWLCLRIFVNSNGYNWRTDNTCPAAA
jgi:hypothetical protein